MQYYISRAGATYGPYPEEEVRRLLAEGRVLPTDYCWTEGMADWQTVEQVFAPRPAAPQPPGPPVPSPPFPEPAARPEPEPVQRPAQAVPSPAPAAAWRAAAAARPGAPAGAAAAFPPDLHWLLVLLLSYITCGIFGYVWMFIEAGFVKKIDPSSPARTFFVIYLAGSLVALPGLFLIDSSAGDALPALAMSLMILAATALFFLGVFSMRRSLLYHYNTVENIGLRLNPVLTFFFNILYFQHHFSRIARWKRTGVLS